MKSILLHIQKDDQQKHRMQCALSLARATGGHLHCLHVTPSEAYASFDNLSGVFTSTDILKIVREEEAEIRAEVEKQLQHEDVRWDYAQLTGSLSISLTRRSALADILIVGRTTRNHELDGLSLGLLGKLLHRSEAPLLISGTEPVAFDPCGPALITWNGSYEAAHSVRAALSLLKVASSVDLISFHEEKPEVFPNTMVLEYLSSHGIHASYRHERMDFSSIVRSLMAHFDQSGAQYLVAGAYGHSRIGEFLFGGVTRDLLKEASFPLLMAR